jgi:uncharacterized protein involved in exopolysaccharide biosynthesis
MREVVTMKMISADVIDPRSGRPGKATIAFTLSFDHKNASTAQKVANELVSLYLSENLRVRRESAAEATTFLTSEAARLEREISDIEKRLADLKEKNVGSLPEQLQYNLQLIERAEQEQRDLDRQAQSLEERQVYLESQLLQISPSSYGSSVDGGPVLSPAQRLEMLRTEMIGASSRYGSEHPDVVRLRREIEALEKETHGGADVATLRHQLENARTELAVAKERYAEGHPDVIKLQRQVAQIESSLAEAKRVPAGPLNDQPPDNPAYIQLQAQLEATRAEIRAITEQRATVGRKMAMYEERITKTPLVEREYLHLKRLQEDSTSKYHEIKSKQMTAQLGQAMETERKSERFSLIEPPVLPIEPESPNRIAIVVLGLVLSLGAGAGTAVLAEAMDSAVYGPRQVAAITGVAPLVVVPYIRTRGEIIRTWRNRAFAGIGSVVVLSAAIAYVHYNVRPLDVLWIGIEHRLDTLRIKNF